VVELDGGSIRGFDVTPEQAGVRRAEPGALKGGDPAHNAEALRNALNGERGAYRDIALVNAAAGLIVAGRARSLEDGVAKGAAAIDSGTALGVLDRLIAVSNA
jgi:anthranilate phosphoribosyltransferase